MEFDRVGGDVGVDSGDAIDKIGLISGGVNVITDWVAEDVEVEIGGDMEAESV